MSALFHAVFKPGFRVAQPSRAWLLVAALFFAAPRIEAACEPIIGRYDGPLFDAMAQIEAGMASTVLRSMNQAGVSRMAIFARDKRKRSGAAVRDLVRTNAGMFVMGAPKSFDERRDLSGGFIREVLAGVKSRDYAFVGEILFTHGDKSHGAETADGERYVDPGEPGTRRLLDGLKGLGAPLMAHWEVYDWERDWPLFHQIYAAYPDQVFIWPHAGFASASQLRTVLAAHPNVVATLSKKEARNLALADEEKAEQLGEAIVDECGNVRAEWRALIVEYRDRLMFATDAHKDFRWRKYGVIVATWRRILAQLPPEVAADVAYANAQRFYAIAR